MQVQTYRAKLPIKWMTLPFYLVRSAQVRHFKCKFGITANKNTFKLSAAKIFF